jgi:multidrug efflux pump subunit AcrA (membrane-fusion protein)
MKNQKVLWLISVVLVLSVTACSGVSFNGNDNGDLHASGRISALQVDIAPEVGGIVQEINVEEGDTVEKGDVLFRIDNTLLQAQYNQATAMVDVAKTAIESANAQLAAVELQLEITLQGVRQQEQLAVDFVWKESQQMILICLFGISPIAKTWQR